MGSDINSCKYIVLTKENMDYPEAEPLFQGMIQMKLKIGLFVYYDKYCMKMSG